MKRSSASWFAIGATVLLLAGVAFSAAASGSGPLGSSAEAALTSAIDDGPSAMSPAANAEPFSPSSSLAAPIPPESPSAVVDADLAAEVSAATAPASGIPAVFLADADAQESPDFQEVASRLVKLDDGLFEGDLTAADLAIIAGVDGLKVSRNRTLRVEPPVPAESPFHLAIDSDVTVPEVDPSLASTRTALGIQGTGEVIAVVDTGIDTNAVGLAGKVLERRDFSPTTTSCSNAVLDPIGHGTHVSSIAAGGVNATEPTVVGVAPDAKLIDVRVFNCAGAATTALVDSALNWILTNHAAKGITAVNLSLGEDGGPQDGTDTTSVIVNRLVAAGVFVSVSAGNDGDDPTTIYSPGTAFYATTVGAAAVNQYGEYLSYFSSQGPLPSGDGVDLLAAGSSIRAAKSTANTWAGNTSVFSGTSMSAPYVAGLAALLHQQNPGHAPSGTSCTWNSVTCPYGVVPASMSNQLETDISTGDWFVSGSDPVSGRGLVSATNSLLGAPSPAAAHVEGNLDADSATLIEVPPHAQPVALTVVTDPSFPDSPTGNDIFDFSWLDATGASVPALVPCNVQIMGTAYYCDYSANDGSSHLTQRVWFFSSPANAETSWLRLLPTQSGTVSVTAPGLGAALALTTGVKADDVTLDGSGDATVTVMRTAPSASATVLDIVATGEIDTVATVTLPAGAADTYIDVAVTESSGFSPSGPNTAGRLAISSAGSLLVDVSVRFPSPGGDVPGQVTVEGNQIHSGDLMATTIGVTSNGTVFGDSNQQALVRAPSSSGYYTGPFVVEPGSNDALQIAVPQTTISPIATLGMSGNGNLALMYETPSGAGIVAGDGDSRAVTFVHNLTSSANTEIGTSTITPDFDATHRPVMSEDGSSVAYVATGISGEHKLYWQGGTNFGTRNLLVSFGSAYDVVVTGVSAGKVLVETLASPTSQWKARAYPAGGGGYTYVADVDRGTSSMSADGSSVGYAASSRVSAGCFRVANSTTVAFSLSGRVTMGAMRPGSNCSTLVGMVTRVSSFPTGWLGSQLVSMLPNGTRTVLAESYADDVSWLVDSTGTQFVTVSGLQFSVGDTNGLVDAYRGALGVGATVSAATPTITGLPAVGATLSADAGVWSPADAALTYRWSRGGAIIGGAQQSTYAPVAADVGKTLTVTVTGTKSGYFPQSATSAATDVVLSSLDPFLPHVTSVDPMFGSTAGGTEVTITGSLLTDVTSVTFGGVEGTVVHVVDDTHLTVMTPAGTDLRAPVVASNSVGDSVSADSAFFAYTDARIVAGIPEGIADVSNFTAGGVRCYQVTGRAGVPVGAVGVTLNVTASLPDGAGHVRVYPDSDNNGATPAPLVSTVNFEVNRDVANSTTISLPTDGKVCAYSVGGTMSRLILDVEGYTLPDSGIVLTTPEKLVDTRSQPWYHVGSINGPVQPMTDYTVQVGGVGSVPSDAVAVMVNITVVDTNYPGHLRMWASDQEMPNTSVVNFAPETKANSQIVALGADGKIKFRSFSYVPTTMSPVQVLIDVTGYITAGSDFTATTPTTVVETRPAYSPVGLRAGALAQTTVYPLTLDTSVVPAGATAVILNVTAVQPTNFGHIRVYPDTNGLGTTTPPIMSNINFIPWRDIPNMVIVQLPPGRTIDFYTAYSGSGQTNLKVDLIGYIEAPPL